jgi:hypothetical protein
MAKQIQLIERQAYSINEACEALNLSRFWSPY